MLAGYYFFNTVKKGFCLEEIFEGHTGYQYQYQYQKTIKLPSRLLKILGNKCVNYAQG